MHIWWKLKQITQSPGSSATHRQHVYWETPMSQAFDYKVSHPRCVELII